MCRTAVGFKYRVDTLVGVKPTTLRVVHRDARRIAAVERFMIANVKINDF
jgi:hypothetical protein